MGLPYPLRKARKTNKAKIPLDNHAEPLRKQKKQKDTQRSEENMASVSLDLPIPHETLFLFAFCPGDDVGPTKGGGSI